MGLVNKAEQIARGTVNKNFRSVNQVVKEKVLPSAEQKITQVASSEASMASKAAFEGAQKAKTVALDSGETLTREMKDKMSETLDRIIAQRAAGQRLSARDAKFEHDVIDRMASRQAKGLKQLPEDIDFTTRANSGKGKAYLEKYADWSRQHIKRFKYRYADAKDTPDYKKALELMENPGLKADMNSKIPIERVAARSQEHTSEEISEIIQKHGIDSGYATLGKDGTRLLEEDHRRTAFGIRQSDGTIKFLNPKDGAISEQLKQLRASGCKDNIVIFTKYHETTLPFEYTDKWELFPDDTCILSMTNDVEVSSCLVKDFNKISDYFIVYDKYLTPEASSLFKSGSNCYCMGMGPKFDHLIQFCTERKL